MSDIKELKDKQLKYVTGGYTVNGDGTYSFSQGEIYWTKDCGTNKKLFDVYRNYSNLTLDDFVECEIFIVDSIDNLVREEPNQTIKVKDLITYPEYRF